jgi:hypothetical protein
MPDRYFLSKYALSFLSCIALSNFAAAQHAFDCSSLAERTTAATETKSLLAALKTTMDVEQAELEDSLDEARATLNEQDQSRLILTVLQSKTNTEFDRQINSLVGELQAMLQASQRGGFKGPNAECRYVAQLRELVGKLGTVYRRQSAYVAEQLSKVKSAHDR